MRVIHEQFQEGVKTILGVFQLRLAQEDSIAWGVGDEQRSAGVCVQVRSLQTVVGPWSWIAASHFKPAAGRLAVAAENSAGRHKMPEVAEGISEHEIASFMCDKLG